MTLPITNAGRELWVDGLYHRADCELNRPDGAGCDCELPERIAAVEREAIGLMLAILAAIAAQYDG